jgi:WD40 repeat protein/sterol desaturase/sphingolipid hydroxylase (fatty acid hydroxylase superfamily)
VDWTLLTQAWLTTLARLGALAVGLGVLTWCLPCNPGSYWWKNLRGLLTDLAYWFVGPLFARLATLALLVVGMKLLYNGAEPHLLRVKSLPLWLQAVVVLLIQDVMLYWIHRAFHRRWAWRFHAVHHSPTVLDWTSTARFHPVNQVFSFCLADAAVLLLGFSDKALAALGVFNVAYSAFVHANLNWTFGPFRHVLASPVFHRWHHTSEKEGLDKNFASTFPVLDVIFGTFYLPEGKLPERFGCGDPDVPESFVGQLVYPFRRPGKLLSGSLAARAALGAGCLALVVLGWLLGLSIPAKPVASGLPQVSEVVVADKADLRYDLVTRAPVLGVAISADGKFVASSGADGAVKRWDPAAGQAVTFAGHARSVKSVAISADGGRIVSGSYDRTVCLWDGESGNDPPARPLWSDHCAMGVLGVAISADGGTVVSSCANGTLRICKAGQPAPLSVRSREIAPGVAVSPDGFRVAGACADGTVRVWDAATGKQQLALRGPAGIAYCAALSEGGRRVVAGGDDGVAYVWDGETHERLFRLVGHREGVQGVAITPDGGRIVTGDGDGAVRVWDGRTGEQLAVFKGHQAGVTGVAVSADGGTAVSGSQDGTAKVWNLPPAN